VIAEEYTDRFASVAAEMEKSLLGSILIDCGRCHDAMRLVAGSDFIDADLGRFFDLIASLAAQGKPVSDSRWLVSAIQGTDAFRAIGSVGLAEIVASVPHAAHAMHYAEEVRRFSQRRQLQEVAARILSDCHDEDLASTDIADRAIRGITLAQENTGAVDSFTAGDCATAAMNRAVAVGSGKVSAGISTGIQCIDSIAGSMLPGEMIILAARPSIGKTALAIDIACNAAQRGFKSLFVSCEMEHTSIGDRLLSRHSGIDCETIQSGIFDADKRMRLDEAHRFYADLPITAWIPAKPSVAGIASKARSVAAKTGLDFLIVDHIGLLNASTSRSRYEAITEITRSLKQLAIALSMPILALCQLNRTGEGELPTLAMLRDSGSVEEDADKVWFLHRDRKDTETVFRVAKFRNGSVGDLAPGWLVFDKDRCSFRDSRIEFSGDF
jgi:replicative DNA helicase